MSDAPLVLDDSPRAEVLERRAAAIEADCGANVRAGCLRGACAIYAEVPESEFGMLQFTLGNPRVIVSATVTQWLDLPPETTACGASLDPLGTGLHAKACPCS